ncbi:MAG: carboxylate--amine ligase, partial [Actinomyces sp.]|nr:carboxylate--amine ligase [Actinomyces sp.]
MHLTFSSSERSTIGVEWELQLIDKDSNDLRQAANAILDAPEAQVDGKLHPHIQREMLLNTIEI